MIDIHTHYGVIEGQYNMPLDMLLDAMKENGIKYALISNIECGIYHECIEGNVKMLDMVRKHKDRLGCMLWGCENLDDLQKEEFEKLYLANQEIVKGIKIHPDISERRADDECFDFFYQFAQTYSLPVLLHTKDSPYSSVKFVVNAAKKYPDTLFILGHMGLGSDGHEALEAVKKYENVYGDTAWVRFDVIEKAEKMGISHKIMFGTDSPISGETCYEDPYYKEYYSYEQDFVRQVVEYNARRIFQMGSAQTFFSSVPQSSQNFYKNVGGGAQEEAFVISAP